MTAIATIAASVPAKTRTGVGAFLRRHPTVVIGGAILLLIVVASIAAPWLGTVDPIAINPAQRLRNPSAEHWFGTDRFGRDLYSRVMYGGRVSLIVGLSVAGLSTVIGLAIGIGVCKFLLVYAIPLDPQVYFISRLPVDVRPLEFILVGVFAVVVCLLATVWPALYASRLRPAEAFREQ